MKNALYALNIDHRITGSFNTFIVENKKISHIKQFCNIGFLYVFHVTACKVVVI
jgi:hypothetical protein